MRFLSRFPECNFCRARSRNEKHTCKLAAILSPRYRGGFEHVRNFCDIAATKLPLVYICDFHRELGRDKSAYILARLRCQKRLSKRICQLKNTREKKRPFYSQFEKKTSKQAR